MSPSSTPRWPAIRVESSGCERPEKTINRFCGPRSSQCPGSGLTWSVTASSPGSRVSSLVVAMFSWLSTLVNPPFLGDLPRREAGERSRRDVVRDDRSRPKPSIVANRDRSNKRIVDTGPDVPADRGLPLSPSRLVREVRGHVPGCDVGVLADLGITDVGEVRHLRPGADARLLDLHERARLRPRFENGAGAKVTERPDQRALADGRVDHDRVWPHLAAPRAPGRCAHH